MLRQSILFCFLALMVGFVGSAIAQDNAKFDKAANAAASASPAQSAASTASHNAAARPAGPNAATDERIARLEGEKRFRTNCGRCHQAPHKFPPRVMATAIRHMRVRATITDEDMRLILRYMTQ